jgi:putative NADPH-quinone reductase
MKILIILGHPSCASFSHAIAQSVRDDLFEHGCEVIFHDLHKEEFPPLLPAEEIPAAGKIAPIVEKHCRELVEADGIVIVHPNWWGQPPAILKGWIDRVIRPGVAYRFKEGDDGEGVPIGLLQAAAAVVFNTGNTPQARETEVFGDPLEAIWRHCIFELCGVSNFHRKLFSVIVTSSEEQRAAWLEEAKKLCREAFLKHYTA